MRWRIVILILGVLGVFAYQASANFASISNIAVTPSQPLSTDYITIDVSGLAANGGSHIVSSLFQQEGIQLALDLTVDMGITTVISNWSYSSQIGPLDSGNYLLTVRLFVPVYFPGDELQDTHITEFTVTPEPSTLVILSFALPIFRYFTRRKI